RKRSADGCLYRERRQASCSPQYRGSSIRLRRHFCPGQNRPGQKHRRKWGVGQWASSGGPPHFLEDRHLRMQDVTGMGARKWAAVVFVHGFDDWPAAGFVDTEIRCLTELESWNAEKE